MSSNEENFNKNTIVEYNNIVDFQNLNILGKGNFGIVAEFDNFWMVLLFYYIDLNNLLFNSPCLIYKTSMIKTPKFASKL